MEKEKELPSVILTERAAQVFKIPANLKVRLCRKLFCESVPGQVDVQVGNMS